MKKAVLKRLLSVALVVCVICALLVPASAANEAVLEAKNGVVEMIMAYSLDNGDLLELSYGSGFLINDSAVMTCYHCVEPDEVVEQIIAEITGKEYNPDRLTYRVVVSGDVTRTATLWPDAYSARDDWAVLRLSDTINGKNILPLGDSDNTETDAVFALGFPDSSSNDVPKYTAEDVTVTNGVVSKLTSISSVPTIEHDAQISAGSSGGPLVNENGVVIGVNYGGSTADGANFTYLATQINSIKTVLDALNVEYTDATETVEAIAEITEEPEATEAITPEPSDEPVETAAPAPTEEPTPVPSVEPVEAEEESSNLALILGIVGGVILIAVVVVVVIVLVNSKKKSNKPGQGVTRPPVTSAGSTVGAPPVGASPSGTPPVAPFATSGQQQRPYASPDSVGATTVLGGDGGAGETTVLGGGASASLTRSKNGEITRINRNEFVIGKERAKVDCCISDNSSVSRRHAKIMARGGKYYVVDLGSTNCTYVNGAKVIPNMETEIVNGDKLKFSDEEYVFHC